MAYILLIISFSLLAGYIAFLFSWQNAWQNATIPVKKQPVNTSNISVIIPFRNEADQLGTLLNTLKTQSLPKDSWELILVNDHSTDQGLAVINQNQQTFTNLRVINNDKQGKKAALKKGVSIARGEYIVTTDADCHFQTDWLKTIVSCIHHHAPQLIIGPVKMNGDDSFLSRFQEMDFLALQMCGAGAALAGTPFLCNGANLVFNKGLYQHVNLKEKYQSGDDMFLLEAVKKSKGVVHYLKSRSAIVETATAPTLQAFLKQRGRWLSKSPGYNDTTVIVVAVLVFFVNALQLLLLVAALFNYKAWPCWLIFFLGKTAVDYRLIKSGQSFFNQSISFSVFAGMQLIYPVYMMASTIAGFLIPVKWKKN
ncbi:glycosyltransferase [Marinilabiliaceae bacterium JC017]|nr:glycosyltransferase [Marinilabiliaceae bacterium JC017]